MRDRPRATFATAMAMASVGFVVTTLSCGSTSSTATSSCANVELLVAASDYSSSVVCGAPGCVQGAATTGIDLGRDPMLASTNGRAFFLARDEDLFFELDPHCGKPLAKSKFSVKLDVLDSGTSKLGSANPHDVAAAPDGTLVVTLFNVPRLAFIEDGTISSLDLSSYDPDGNPQAESVRIVTVGGSPKAFVTLELLDDNGKNGEYLASRQPAKMLRVDVATHAVEAVIGLAGRNPFNPMTELDGELFMAEPGTFDRADDDLAGIERFDTATSTTALLVREHDLGGSVSEVAVTDGCGAAIVAGPEHDVNPTSVVIFDPRTGTILAGLPAPLLGPTPGYDLQGLAWRGHDLYVGDRRRGANGYPVHIFELARPGTDCTLVDTGRTIDLPAPPVALRTAK